VLTEWAVHFSHRLDVLHPNGVAFHHLIGGFLHEIESVRKKSLFRLDHTLGQLFGELKAHEVASFQKYLERLVDKAEGVILGIGHPLFDLPFENLELKLRKATDLSDHTHHVIRGRDLLAVIIPNSPERG